MNIQRETQSKKWVAMATMTATILSQVNTCKEALPAGLSCYPHVHVKHQSLQYML